MTIEQYNKKAKELNTIIETVRSSFYGLNASTIGVVEDENGIEVDDISAYQAEKMYKNNMILNGLASEIKSLSDKYTKLNSEYFNLYLDK